MNTLINGLVWSIIPEFPNYMVSTTGLILNHKSGRVLKQSTNRKGQRYVCLSHKGVAKTLYVSRLVAQAYLPGYREDLPVLHKDRLDDNSVKNLRVDIGYTPGRKRWVVINGFEDYKISSKGEVKNRATGLILKTHMDSRGTRSRVNIYKNTKMFNLYVEDLLKAAFG